MDNEVPYALSKNALSGLPNFTLPDFTIQSSEKTYTFWDTLLELNVGIIVIPIIGVLTNISIGKLSKQTTGTSLDLLSLLVKIYILFFVVAAPKGMVNSNQELATLGLCNIFGSCVQAMPSSGAFTRYAISTACGLKTPMANLYSGKLAT